MHEDGAADVAARRYLDLLKKCLTRSIFESYAAAPVTAELMASIAGYGWIVVEPVPVDLDRRAQGKDWPADAETMVGLARLDNLEHCVASIVRDQVPGDLIEAGVWRGGSTIFMRAALEAFGDRHRRVWVADSFRGLPKPEVPGGDAADEAWLAGNLAVGVEEVRANFEKYGLLDDRVQFLEGWFADTLPVAPIEQLALVRLDGDLYESTMQTLTALYPKLSPGGYLVVDDYGAVPQCRRAVEDFRRSHGVSEPIHEIDWTGVYWRRAASGTSIGAKPAPPPAAVPPVGLAARIARVVPAGGQVLVLGDEDGSVSCALRNRACRVVAVEVTEQAAARASEFCDLVVTADLGGPGLPAALAERRFDAIVASPLPDELAQPAPALARLGHLLEPDGSVVVSVHRAGRRALDDLLEEAGFVAAAAPAGRDDDMQVVVGHRVGSVLATAAPGLAARLADERQALLRQLDDACARLAALEVECDEWRRGSAALRAQVELVGRSNEDVRLLLLEARDAVVHRDLQMARYAQQIEHLMRQAAQAQRFYRVTRRLVPKRLVVMARRVGLSRMVEAATRRGDAV